MPVQINITGADAAESLRELSALSFGLCGNVPVATSSAPVKEEPKTRRASTKSEEKKIDMDKLMEEEGKQESSKEDKPQNGSDSSDTGEDDAEGIPDDVALREAATSKAAEVGKAKIKALLDKHGVKNVTAIPTEKRIDFLRELVGMK